MDRKFKSPLELFEEKKVVNICAPMVRYSKLPFRELVREYNCDLTYTPMILADVFKNSNYARECDFTTNEKDNPVIIQFAATNATDLADAAELAAPFVSGVDLNCGCAQKWAINEGIGSYLMEHPELVRDMVRQTKNRVNIPCSIKIRAHKDLRQTVEFAKRAESVGVDFITVHGRTRRQKSSEPVNLEAIKLVKESASVPIVANGDIFSREDAEHIAEYTKVDGVMAARGILHNPALFAHEEVDPWDYIKKYIELALGYGTNFFIFHHHLMFMFEGVMSNAERKTFNTLSSISAVLDHLRDYYGLEVTPPSRSPSL
ncbi:tRNA-dihydrouridine synthase [Basidiobolus meristosporus CBS 931.73]|uniref:tRNA-dihydrouridine synthase n=1 Tax=Basidiobolus meristosporus CBS 931.73 TaxID=1314790 RepID=A0A1Y1YGR6_9FUNG|nr:tRNA-dihydrouridine synthase [Basidiobolus meristosporus CBS 931.73]|eukprot:ORX97202.1 tRNA-dihydrouridine synthase [Basidiobolus meristosporus CBS 931.73]